MGLYSMLVACFGLVPDDCTHYMCWYMGIVHQMHNLYVTKVWVHCAGISCTIACYGIGTIIPDCNCQYLILYYCIYLSRLGVSVWIISAEFFSSRFCWVLGTWNLFVRRVILHSPFSQLASYKTYHRKKLEISCEDVTHCVSLQETHPAKKYF